MPRQLSDAEIDELTGGGISHSHYHIERPTHETVDQLQDQSRIVQTAAAFYDALSIDDVIIANSNSNDVVVTLPPVIGQKEYIVSKAATANNVHVVFSGGSTCYGAGSVLLTFLGEVVRLKAYLGNWITI